MFLNERRKALLKAKVKAYTIHLLLSLLVFFTILYIILKYWYPGPFFSAHGGWHGVKILFIVDMVLGPLLTLMVYNCYKSMRDIVFDLSIIAVIQIAALTWGTMAIYSKKPAAVVFWEDRFYTVSMDYYQAMGISQQQLNQFSGKRPPLIFAKRPVGVEAMKEMARVTMDEKIPAFAQVALYEPIKDNMAVILQFSHEYDGLLKRKPGRFREVELSGDLNAQDVFGTFLMSKHRSMFLLLTKEGDFVGYLEENEGDSLF